MYKGKIQRKFRTVTWIEREVNTVTVNAFHSKVLQIRNQADQIDE